MDKKNLPLDILIPSGVALLASFLPWFGLGFFGGAFSRNAWNAGVMFYVLPTIFPILAMVAIGVFAFLKAEKKWVAPKNLNLGLAIYASAHLALIFLRILFAGGIGALGIGFFLAAGASGYLTYLIIAKKRA